MSALDFRMQEDPLRDHGMYLIRNQEDDRMNDDFMEIRGYMLPLHYTFDLAPDYCLTAKEIDIIGPYTTMEWSRKWFGTEKRVHVERLPEHLFAAFAEEVLRLFRERQRLEDYHYMGLA